MVLENDDLLIKQEALQLGQMSGKIPHGLWVDPATSIIGRCGNTDHSRLKFAINVT